MTGPKGMIRRSERGSAAVQFAMAVPLVVLFLAGIAQLGVLFAATAGLQQALGEGARMATLFPRPTDAAISARVTRARFALDSRYLTGPSLTHGISNGVPYVDISLTYSPPLNFVFFTGPSISITKSRRAYQN